MKILNNVAKNSITFTSIELKPEEKENSDKLLASLRASKNDDNIKTDLFNMYDVHIRKEAIQKLKNKRSPRALIQQMYLNFYEALDNIETLTTQKLIDILNATKADKIRKTKSNPQDNNEPVENKNNKFSQYQKYLDNDKLTQREREVLEKKTKGMSYSDIAIEENKSIDIVRRHIKNAIAKIKYSNGELPESFDFFAEKLISKYNLEIEKSQIKKMLLSNANLISIPQEKLFNNIAETSILLKIKPKEFVMSAIKQPRLFNLTPETISKNVNQTSEFLKMTPKEYVKMALKRPQLFGITAEKIAENLAQTAEELQIPNKSYLEAALKFPPLLSVSPKTVVENVKGTAKLLNTEKEEIINAAYKNPSLFCRKPEVVVKTIKIIQYYKEIQNKKADRIVPSTLSEKNLYGVILNYLVKKSDGLDGAIPKNDFVNYLKSVDKAYNFEIPNHELTNEFVKFATDFSEKNFAKQIFSFKVIK